MQRAQQPVGLKYGLLFKCSQKLKMWSSTWFVLGAAEITYYKRGAEAPKTIDLQQPISIVAADVGDTKRPHSFKLTTKAFPRTLIVAAETSEQADEWIAAIRTVASIYSPPPESKEGVIKLNPDQKSMLECTNQIVQLTGKLVSVACQCNVPGVYSKLILDNLSVSALMCSTTGRVVVFKPKVQTGNQRFTSSVVDTQALLVKYKHTFQAAKTAAGVRDKGKDNSPIAAATAALEALIAVMERTVSTWMPSMLDSDLIKPLDEMAPAAEVEEDDEVEKIEPGSVSPYVAPFMFDSTPITSSPAPCKKHWDLLIDECAGIIAYMESIGKGAPSALKQPPQSTIEQAKVFLNMSKRLHEIPSSSSEVNPDGLSEDKFSLMKQQLLGSVSTIDYHTANIGLMCDDAMPPQVVDIISHAYGISSAISKLPRAIRKHRTQTLVSAVENIGSFSFSLSKLITQMVDHESLRDARGRQTLRDEVHAIQYIALHMLGMCTTLVEGGYKSQDVLAFADTAKLLALSVTNTLESLRQQLVPAKRKRGNARKLASELTDAATGSMVFWFGLVGQNASIHLAA